MGPVANGILPADHMEASRQNQRRPIEVGRVIREVFGLYAEFAAQLLFPALAIFLVVGSMGGVLNDSASIYLQFLANALQLVATALYTGYVVALVGDVRDGRRDFTIRELFSSASKSLGALILNGVLWGLAITVGIILFVVPGLFLATIWAVCQPAIVVERRGALEAFGRSQELVRGQGWPVLGTILVAILIQVVVAIFAVGIGAGAGVGALIAATIITSTLSAPVSALVASVLFFDLGGGAPEPAADDRQVVIEY